MEQNDIVYLPPDTGTAMQLWDWGGGGGGTRHFFLITLYNFKNIGGGTCPPAPPPLPRGPRDIVKRRHVFFAIDNVDFTEDTPDGKRTFHGTAMDIY